MITIAIPFYNAEKYLENAIKSVLKQTYSSWELFLVDDGSTDHSLEIAKKFQKVDSRIKVYSDGLNKNLPNRLNEISILSNRKYLARMDADDIMHPDRIKKQLEILEKHPEIDVLGTNVYSIDSKNKINGLRINTYLKNYQLVPTKTFIHPTVMAKTEWFRKNLYDVKALRVEDYELWLRTNSENIFRVYTEPLLFYREFGSHYYKKYFNGIYSMFYVAKKNKKIECYFFAARYLLKGFIYYILYLMKLENWLIKKRSVKLEDSIIKDAEYVLKEIIR